MAALDPLLELYRSPAALRRYDDSVNQLEHALQCAALAEQAGASDALVAAALLHDVGHLLTAAQRTAGERPGDDPRHEAVAGRYLRTWFGPEVTAPVVLHVSAKRYLCGVDDGYFGLLSPGSVHSLELQGGPMTEAECAAFDARDGAQDAVAVRRWDDGAKVVGADVAPFDHYVPLLERLS